MKLRMSIRTKFGILMAIFLVVMSGTIITTFWVNSLQKDYALIINLAGRQRMLTQKMTKETFAIARAFTPTLPSPTRGEEIKRERIKGLRDSLSSARNLFDKTLKAFILGGETIGGGGQIVVIRKVSTPELKERLEEAEVFWDKFSGEVDAVIMPATSLDEFQKAVGFIEANSESLVDKMNVVTGIYQRESEENVAFLEKILIWTLIMTLIGAFGAFVVFSRIIVTPLRKVSDNLKAIASGNLKGGDLKVKSRDEIGEMVKTVNIMTANLKGMVKDVGETSLNVKTVSDEIMAVAGDLLQGADEQAFSAKKASVSIDGMNKSVSEIAGNTSKLSTVTEEASSSILEMTASIDEVDGISQDLSRTVEEVSSSITEMAMSVKEIMEHAAGLSSYTSDTATAISEIDASIKEVEGNLKVSAKLSEGTRADASFGRDAVKNTAESMERIRKTVDDVSAVIRRLGARSEAIGKILNVINEMAEQTNLLALNAAIIAAQAGEHGKGFAVVADEIKEFADRTTSSTREIDALIRSVQGEVGNSIKSFDSVGKGVEEGVELAKRAGEALEKILSSANSSSEMVEEIAKASAEQLKGSRQVTESMENISEMLKKVYKAIADQEKGSSYIAKAAEKMKDASQQVSRATREQSKGGELISKGIENVSGMVKSIDKSTQGQASSGEEVVKVIDAGRLTAEKNVTIVKKMRAAAEMLANRMDVLNNAIKKFQG